MGAPNVDDYLPGPHSIIKVSDFKTAKELGDYVNMLSKNPDKYNEYHKWRGNGWSANYTSMIQETYHSLPCRVCEKVAKLQNKIL